MLKSFTFGCGQGATKAMITCIESGVLNKSDCCVVNSTIKDIPVEYHNNAIVISEDENAGCGKVRGAAKKLMFKYLKNNPNVIDQLIDDDVDYVNIMATTEGASGSGASVMLANYIKGNLGIPVIITLISGFESDTRGLANTIDYFKDLNGGDFIVRTVSNKKFLDQTSNTFTAEKLANEDIAKAFKIINAADIINSDQNIDDTDHYKLITNPGLMFVNEVIIDKKLKNPNQFEQLVSDAIDYSSSLDFEPSATKIGVFMNISDNNLAIIDTNFTAIKKKLCGNNIVAEFFTHKQYDANRPEFVRIIASGMNLPKDEVSDMYKKYQNSITVDSTSDDFFNVISNMDTTSTIENTTTSDNTSSFFEQFSDAADNDEEDTVIRRSRRKKRSDSPAVQTIPGNNTDQQQPKKKSKFIAGATQPYSEDTDDIKGY